MASGTRGRSADAAAEGNTSTDSLGTETDPSEFVNDAYESAQRDAKVIIKALNDKAKTSSKEAAKAINLTEGLLEVIQTLVNIATTRLLSIQELQDKTSDEPMSNVDVSDALKQLTATITELTATVRNTSNDNVTSSPSSAPQTYATMAGRQPQVKPKVTAVRQEPVKKVILVYAKDDDNIDANVTKAHFRKAYIPSKSSVKGAGLTNVRSIGRGGIAVECNSDDVLNDIVKTLGTSANLKTVTPKTLQPRLIVHGVFASDVEPPPTGADKDNFIDVIHQQNCQLGDNLTLDELKAELKVVTVIPCRVNREAGNKAKKFNWILEASPRVHKIVLQKNGLYVEHSKYRVENHVSLLRCFKCCGFGHKAADCRQKNQLCSHCGEEHKLDACPYVKKNSHPVCLHCFPVTRRTENTRFDKKHSHDAFSHECPVYQQKVASIHSRTDYGY
jgi:hypothetical protein